MEQAMECGIVRDEMIEVLYAEASPETQRRVEEHLAVCATCREEIAALRGVRHDLKAWSVPEMPRGRPARPRLASFVPLAAAAGFVLALGAGFAFSGSEARFEDGRFAFRLGRGADATRELASAEARHRQEIEELRGQLASATRAIPSDAAFGPVSGEQFQALLRESEERQARRLEVSLRELSVRTEAQRRYDLARVSAGLSYLDGKTGQHVARTTELMGYVLQAAEKK
jgi:hypothetical protein